MGFALRRRRRIKYGTDKDMTLNPKHLEEMQASGLSNETLEKAGVYSADANQLRQVLGNPPKTMNGWGTGWVIPFRLPGQQAADYWRAKLDFPREDAKGNPIKYESPRARGNRAYFPPGFDIQATEILITEGEKKALKVQQEGFNCIGLIGTYGWVAQRRKGREGRRIGPKPLLAELLAVPWPAKQVYIIYDSDAATNPQVRQAERELAKALTDKGAVVHIVRLPGEPDA